MTLRQGPCVTPKRSSPSRLVSRSSEILLVLAIAAVVYVAIAAAMKFGVRHPVSRQDTNLAESLPTDYILVTETAARRIYPYSIVAGGVQSSTEVARAMADDATVAAHYAGLDPSQLRVDHVSGPERAYASYRLGGQVYWTRHPIALHDGEAILTDGITKLRARCGNKLSDEPQQPVSPDEPDEAAFERLDGLLPGTPMLDLVFTNSIAPPIAAGESDSWPPFIHGPQAPYLLGFALGDPADPGDGSGAVIGGPPIDLQPILGEPIAPVAFPEPSPAGESDPGSIFLLGTPEAFLMQADPIDPGDLYVDPHVDIGDTRDGESLTPVPEPGTVMLVGLGLAAAVFHARRRSVEPTTVD